MLLESFGLSLSLGNPGAACGGEKATSTFAFPAASIEVARRRSKEEGEDADCAQRSCRRHQQARADCHGNGNSRACVGDINNSKKQRMQQPTKASKTSNSSQQLKLAQSEQQKLDPAMKTPEELDAQTRSPSLYLRRRKKKARSRAALLNNLSESEYQIIQQLDFNGCSDVETDGMQGRTNDENATNSSNVDEKTPPMTLKRKLPQSSELSAAAKRKKMPTDAPKKNTKSKSHGGATQAVDAAKLHTKLAMSSEQLNAPIRNTCVLDSPDDEPSRKAKRSKYRNKRTTSSHATKGEQQSRTLSHS